jgi:hypothetical protein
MNTQRQDTNIFVAVAEALQSMSIGAEVWELDGPVTCVQVREGARVWLFGTANEMWGANLLLEDGDVSSTEYIEAGCSSAEVDAVIVAKAIADAIAPKPTPTTVGELIAQSKLAISCDADLAACPLESVCGKAIQQIVDAATKLLALCDPHPKVRGPIASAVKTAIDIVYYG